SFEIKRIKDPGAGCLSPATPRRSIPMRSIAVLSVLALAACSANKAAVEADHSQPAPTPEPREQAKVTSASSENAEGAARLDAALKDLQSVSVFFKFDDDTLTDQARDKLATVGRLLARYRNLRVRVE